MFDSCFCASCSQVGPLLEAERAALAASQSPNAALLLDMHAPGELEARSGAAGEATPTLAAHRALCVPASLSPNPNRPPTPPASPARTPPGPRAAEPDRALVRGGIEGGDDEGGPADAGSQGRGTPGAGPGSRHGGAAQERLGRRAKRARREPSPSAELPDTAELPVQYNGRCPPASRWIPAGT